MTFPFWRIFSTLHVTSSEKRPRLAMTIRCGSVPRAKLCSELLGAGRVKNARVVVEGRKLVEVAKLFDFPSDVVDAIARFVEVPIKKGTKLEVPTIAALEAATVDLTAAIRRHR